jgi:hypothetical protein
MRYPGIDGFLGTRASFMLDFVVVAMVGILALLGLSVWLVKYRRAYQWHKRIQLTLAAVLAITVLVFETDMRINGWQARAVESPYYGSPQQHGIVFTALYVHLFFALTTVLMWLYTIVQALRKFPWAVVPGPYSQTHRLLGWLAALDMVGTAVTGWIFYWLAFVAT